MIPSSNDLHYFVEVAATLNISRAAERLGISQPSLSLAMKRLEDNLGVPLLVRTKTGVTLTRAGNKFNERSRLMIHQWEQIHQEAVNEETVLSGCYTIGCHESVALFSLPNFLPQLMFDYPELEFKLQHDISRVITDDIVNFRTDFGLVVNPVSHPDLVIKELAKDTVTLWKAPGQSDQLNPTNGKGVLIDFPDLIQVQAVQKQLVKKGYCFGRTITTGSLELTAALVAAGAGLGIIPSRVATRLPSQRLEPVKGAPKVSDRICLIYRADTQKSKASKLLAAALSKCLQ